MAKALLGTHTTLRALELLDEIRALRHRVAELEHALERAEAARDERVGPLPPGVSAPGSDDIHLDRAQQPVT